MNRTFPLGIGAALAVILADQLSKYLILRHFLPIPADFRWLRVMPSLNLVLTSNPGVTFGLFNNSGRAGTILFSVVALAVSTGLLVWLRQVTRAWLAIAIGLVIGGALGNMADRVRLGAVVDFIDFYIGSWHWYTFNLADACIDIGVAMLLLDSVLFRGEEVVE